MRRTIENADAACIALLDGGDRILFVELYEEIAERAGSKSNGRKREALAVSRHKFSGFQETLLSVRDSTSPRRRRSCRGDRAAIHGRDVGWQRGLMDAGAA
jgi:hypothetical protein